jgi:hypothetical protein
MRLLSLFGNASRRFSNRRAGRRMLAMPAPGQTALTSGFWPSAAVSRQRCAGVCGVRDVWLVSGPSIAQSGKCELVLSGQADAMAPDPPHADAHQSAELEQLQPQVGSANSLCEARFGARRTAAGRPSRRTTGAVDWRAWWRPTCDRRTERAAFFNRVLRLTTRAVDRLVKMLPPASDGLSDVTTKRALAPPPVTSALTTTRRSRLQLSSVA